MLASAWVILLEFQFFWLGARVLFGNVKIAGVSGAYEFNL